ncbi:hypothetical protein JCM8547_009343 [Rhodosporidiobolus lusitaniae]
MALLDVAAPVDEGKGKGKAVESTTPPSCAPASRPPARPPRPPTLPLDLFSPSISSFPPFPHPASPSDHPSVSSSSQAATSLSGQLTPPASPSPYIVDLEPQTPRKKPPTPGTAPRSPLPFSNFRRRASQEEQRKERYEGTSTAGTSLFDVAAFPPTPTRARLSRITSSGSRAEGLPSSPADSLQLKGEPVDALYTVSNDPLPSSTAHAPLLPRPSAPSPYPPRIQLLRTTTTPLHPGSTFPLVLRAYNFLPSPYRPLPVTLTFVGTSRIGEEEHILFRLEATVKLDGPLWTGKLTVPERVERCETCGKTCETPWTFSYRDEETGREFGTVYRLEAVADGMKDETEVEVMPSPRVSGAQDWRRLLPEEGRGYEVQGGLEALELKDVELSYRALPITQQPLEATADLPLTFAASLRFRQTSSFSTLDSSQLVSLFWPHHTSLILSAVLIPYGDDEPIPLGGSWTSSASADDFYLKVDSASSPGLVDVKLQMNILPKAVVFAGSSSCGGFAVGFYLYLTVGSPVSSMGTVRVGLPFLPAKPPSLPTTGSSPFSSTPSAAVFRPTPALHPPRISSKAPSRKPSGRGEGGGPAKRAWSRIKKTGRAMRRNLFPQ